MATVAATHQVRYVRRFKPPASAAKIVYLPRPLGLLPRNVNGVSSCPLLSGAPSLLHIQHRPLLRPLGATGQSGKVIAFFHLEENFVLVPSTCHFCWSVEILAGA
jgi:hypothetical protein